MSRLLVTLGTAAGIFIGGAFIPDRASASPLGMPSAGTAIDGIQTTQNVQGGWCFYIDGWNGPGFYRCGYRTRRGYGWHGYWDSRHHSFRESRGHSVRWSRRHGRWDSRHHSFRESRRGRR